MKKYRLIAMALVLCLLLCGCNLSGTSKETTPTLPSLPTAPKEDPKDVAFTCYNYDYDHFIAYSFFPGMRFYILTRECVDVTDIAVTIPVEQGYDVYVYDDSSP